MPYTAADVLAVLDACAAACTFPMLDNGYTYPAAARLSLFRSPDDWAVVVETFGFLYKAGHPCTFVDTFANRPAVRKTPADYVSRAAFDRYLAENSHNESRSLWPVEPGPWLDEETPQFITPDTAEVRVRGEAVPLPALAEYARHGVTLTDPPRVRVFELCRYLAAVRREAVLATSAERRVNVRPTCAPLLVLDDWHHPDLARGEKPSDTATFHRLADVLATGDVGHYRADEPGNTHWSHWPTGGTL